MTVDQSPVAPLSRNDSEIRLQMPPHDNGYAIVRIGESNGAVSRFLYLPPALQDLPPVVGVGPGTFRENGRAVAASPVEAIGPQPDLVVTNAGELLFSGRRIRKIGRDGGRLLHV